MEKITTEDIFNYYHILPCVENNQIAGQIIKDFENLLGVNFDFEFADKGERDEEQLTTQTRKFLSLKNEFVYSSPYVEEFFSLILKYGYMMQHEITEAISKLGNLKNPNENKLLIEELLHSPAIDDVSFNGADKFTIFSEKLGEYSFQLASSYFKHNWNALAYIINNKTEQYAHQNTEELAKILPEFYSITSLCANYFKSYWYHSYSYNKEEDVAIDLCSKAVIEKKNFDGLFVPTQIMKIKNSRLSKHYEEARKNSNQPVNRNMILVTALYNQLKHLKEDEKRLILSYKIDGKH